MSIYPYNAMIIAACIRRSYTIGLLFDGVNATYNNISVMSWRSVLLVEETGEPGEKHRSVASHCKTPYYRKF